MDAVKFLKLKRWRDNQVKKEGVEAYRVLNNQTLEEIIKKDAKTEEELLTVKGIKEKKLAKYGREILAIMNLESWTPASAGVTNVLSRTVLDNENDRASQEIIAASETDPASAEGYGVAKDKIFSVSVFLDLVNTGLRTFEVKIKGEVTSVDARGNVYYFNLKDKTDGSIISCLIWKSNYRLAGVELKEGMEVVIHGFPNVYKPFGRLSFQADTIELVGEGALKQQFEELKKKLENEGLFAPERKKPVPLFVEKIGLITSRQGEAIFDFRTNLGQFGFKIKFVDARVEGVQAVPSLIRAVRYFKDKDIDVLVLVRGGGSLESLLSFNNEMLVREIANFPKPVVSGIGHEQDVSLVDLVVDKACSTPTGVAKFLNYSWEQARARVLLNEKQIIGSFGRTLLVANSFLSQTSVAIKDNFRQILASFQDLSQRLKSELINLGHFLSVSRETLKRVGYFLSGILPKIISQTDLRLEVLAKNISLNDPERQLKLGYGLVYRAGRIIRTIKDISLGEGIEVQLQDGKIYSNIKRIDKKNG
jgi:exodeoxyribonuclease VII large subunit